MQIQDTSVEEKQYLEGLGTAVVLGIQRVLQNYCLKIRREDEVSQGCWKEQREAIHAAQSPLTLIITSCKGFSSKINASHDGFSAATLSLQERCLQTLLAAHPLI